MMQASKKKLVLEHLVVQAAGSKGLAAADLEDIIRYGAAALFANDETAAAVKVEGMLSRVWVLGPSITFIYACGDPFGLNPRLRHLSNWNHGGGHKCCDLVPKFLK